jgi:hypothetical protein
LREADKSGVNDNYIDYTKPLNAVCHTQIALVRTLKKSDREKKLRKVPATLFARHEITCLRKIKRNDGENNSERERRQDTSRPLILTLDYSHHSTELFQTEIDNDIILSSSDFDAEQVYEQVIPYFYFGNA